MQQQYIFRLGGDECIITDALLDYIEQKTEYGEEKHIREGWRAEIVPESSTIQIWKVIEANNEQN